MKFKKKFSIIFFLSGMFFAHSQNVASTANLTSGGLNAGNNISAFGGNTYYGNEAGFLDSGSRNTYIGAHTGTNGGSNNVYVGWKASGTGSNNVLIGWNSGNEERALLGSGNVFIGSNSGFTATESNNTLIIGNEEDKQLIWGDFSLDQLKLNGKVGIGNGFANFPTTAGSVNVANYNLFVKGGILTEEVRVNLQSNWADYVFSPDYKLKTLEEVENYINKNGHLENIPSAKKVKEEGIELGEMIKIQQEKIEELTLYIIQLNKEHQVEKAMNKAMLFQLDDLEEKVNSLVKK